MTSSKDRQKWNDRHGAAPSAGEPSPWAVRHRSLLESRLELGLPGRALDVACGLGRHSIWLAELGFSVEAIDISDIAVERMSRHAEATGLAISARRCDLTTVDLAASGYQAVLVFNYLERSLCPKLANCLAPGGLLLYETFLAVPRGDNHKGPRNPRFLLQPEELPQLFSCLRIVDYQEVEVEGSRVARLLARSPEVP